MPSTGRTTAMIRGLPEDGATIIVPTLGVRTEVQRMILALRGLDFDRSCRVLAVRGRSDLERARVPWLPIVFDHTFEAMTPSALFDYATAWAEEFNEQFSGT